MIIYRQIFLLLATFAPSLVLTHQSIFSIVSGKVPAPSFRLTRLVPYRVCELWPQIIISVLLMVERSTGMINLLFTKFLRNID